MNFSRIPAIFALLVAAACTRTITDHTTQVDPYIGAGGHGHVFVGANVPAGMVRLGPHQPTRGWDWCSGYHISDTLVLGFSHTRLSGTGIGEGGDILLFPYDADKPQKTFEGHPYAGLSHELESVEPGYYSLEMPDNGIRAELTAGERIGVHRYSVTSDRTALLLDLGAGVGWDKPVECCFELVSPKKVEGYRRSTGWAKDQRLYFCAEFSLPIANFEELTSECAPSLERTLLFDTSKEKQLCVTVALSPNSTAKAGDNLAAEAGSFDKVRARAHENWRGALGCIEIEGLDATQEKLFYTSLYHALFDPSLWSDSDEAADYTVFSLWDTYRAHMPMLTLIQPEKCRQLASTMLNIYDHQGKLPVWHLYRCETDCMVGNPGVIALADLFLKGFVTDSTKALEALKVSSMRDERGMELLKVYGYLPFDKSAEVETVSKGLEFAIADAGVAKVARIMGDTEAADYFGKRSKAYTYYYDPQTTFMRGRASDGSYRVPFDPFKALHMRSDFTEGNAWQHTWLVPQDPRGLIELLGGEKRFTQKLDSLFIAEGDLGGDANDVSGLIGQYAHGNEPSHHVTYLYNYVGEQYKCAEKVRHILDSLYFADYTGVCGNEDCGQMSAWYILSSLGLYQVDPSGGEFLIGSPAVKKAVVNTGNGKKLTILAPDNSKNNVYVSSLKVNGKPWTRSSIPYDVLVDGATLEFSMSPVPTGFGKAPEDRP